MCASWPRPLTPRRRRALAHEIEEELEAHLAMRAEDNRRAGMTPAEAEVDARARFGDVEHITEACLWAEETHPVREAQRLLVTGLLFAIGFGAFATAFSLAVAVFVRPLRFDEAQRLVRSGAGWEDARVPFGFFEAWQARSTSFESLTAFNASEYVLGEGEAAERVPAMFVSEDYFRVFQVTPLVGHTLRADGSAEVLISEALWERRFHRSRSVLGQSVSLRGQPHTVIGVMPEAAQLSHRVDLWHRLPEVRFPCYVIGRLRETATLDDVRAEVAAIGPVAGAELPVFYPLKDLYADPVRPTAWTMLGISVLVLLLITGGALRRAWARAQRAALYDVGGADAGTHVGLAVVGAVAGLGIARVTQAIIYDDLLGRWGHLLDRSLDAPVILGVLGVGLGVGALMVHGARRAVARVR